MESAGIPVLIIFSVSAMLADEGARVTGMQDCLSCHHSDVHSRQLVVVGLRRAGSARRRLASAVLGGSCRGASGTGRVGLVRPACCQHSVGDARELVRQRYDGDIVVAAPLQALRPAAVSIVFALDMA